MFVIGVSGQAQMGKDTLADYLAFKLNTLRHVHLARPHWQRAAFAANVKKVYCDTFDVDLEFIEKWKTVSQPPPGFDMPVRQALQFIGDGFRNIKNSIWLDLPFRDKSDPLIISDVRYVNEFLRIKSEGGMNILVVRPDRLNDDPNGSEAQIRPYVDWAIELCRGDKFVQREEIQRRSAACPYDQPPHADKFDAFVLNDGTIDELNDIVDKHVVPFVQQFEFETEEKEGTCLISS